jgi:hypothetical protein
VDEFALGVVALSLATFYRPRFKALLEDERASDNPPCRALNRILATTPR